MLVLYLLRQFQEPALLFATFPNHLPDDGGFRRVVNDKSSWYTLQNVLVPNLIIWASFFECIAEVIAVNVLGRLVGNSVEINTGFGVTRVGCVRVVRLGSRGRVQDNYVTVEAGQVSLRPVVMFGTKLDGRHIG